MKIRSSDREPPGRAAGMVGTLLVHAAAVGFLFGTVKPTKAAPPNLCGGSGSGSGADSEATGPRGAADSAAGGEAGPGQADAAQTDEGAGAPEAQDRRRQPTEEKKEPPPKTTSPGNPGSGRDAQHRQRCSDNQDAGLGVSLSGIPAEHRDPGLPALGPGVGQSAQFRGDQLLDSEGWIRPGHSVSSLVRAALRSI